MPHIIQTTFPSLFIKNTDDWIATLSLKEADRSWQCRIFPCYGGAVKRVKPE